MRVAVFTDADFDRPKRRDDHARRAPAACAAGCAPADLYVLRPRRRRARVPGAAIAGSCRCRSRGWSPLHLPRIRELERRLAADDIRAIHMTTPGLAGPDGAVSRAPHRPAARRQHPHIVACLGVRRTRPVERRALAVRAMMPHYLRWLYGECSTVLVPFADAVRRLTRAGWDADRLVVWPAGADPDAFSPARRSQRLRDEWHVSERRPAILCVGPSGSAERRRAHRTARFAVAPPGHRPPLHRRRRGDGACPG